MLEDKDSKRLVGMVERDEEPNRRARPKKTSGCARARSMRTQAGDERPRSTELSRSRTSATSSARASARCSTSSKRSTSEERARRHPRRAVDGHARTARSAESVDADVTTTAASFRSRSTGSGTRSGARSIRSTSRGWRRTSTRRCAPPPNRRRAATRCAWRCSPRSTSPTSCSAAATRPTQRDGQLAERAEELERLLDRVLMA